MEFRRLPRRRSTRLGTNPALDAASDALVTAHTNFCSSGHPGPECELLAKYSHALNVLRDALDDLSKLISRRRYTL
jgi:hypothetical protein